MYLIAGGIYYYLNELYYLVVCNGEIIQCRGGMGLITDFLPKVQAQQVQFKLHISYFLQKRKKSKAQK